MEPKFEPLLGVRRCTIERYAEILTVARQPVLKQHIIQKCSLNNHIFTVYIKRLIDCGLLGISLGKQRIIYQTTNKGLEFLKQYNELLTILEMPVGQHLLEKLT